MKNLKNHPKVVIAITFTGLLGGLALYGCQSNSGAPAQAVAPADQSGPKFAMWGPPPQRSGADLWADNCARCHNARPPEEFSPAQWQTIIHHMRLRANLTGEEAREITKFLQASSGTQ
jgi:hypothetical protein